MTYGLALGGRATPKAIVKRFVSVHSSGIKSMALLRYLEVCVICYSFKHMSTLCTLNLQCSTVSFCMQVSISFTQPV